ncbi:CDP-diacylglycerol--serine O-phosphatidyltransferase [Paenibacillus helianthi]|uniref:CDP-diacylglycerol--serine O-phosphatidyltransferase n=1 Tax=Paenibacillus helianthi TaxID=1349432 RepID=A0ABX3ELN1_9BACL|nr:MULTISPECIES: CDP-diacylglycerol--serine O-phosphatidyltransferase [Paenibacillus]OKP79528.1 CDP-diacylglycerol--serine O-phosphatidyltransferase [Paenibacillus sp. P3E]OKP85463.1 CDP-diacylglycerol--serine O-phosphatidyltransferase [Paenibacillus helianthi]OKP86296.1 CDP-diacylglycerol--serine O-phosphatidyltransferase [Paenibacillus sp. P32E]
MIWKWIPSICTVFNLGAGAASLIFTIEAYYKIAFFLILLAAFFDVLDGLLARLMNCPSEFGKQLDSLADLISFGAAPVFLILLHQSGDLRGGGGAAAIVFIICGALRLARFNVSASSTEFTGLPITAAGVILSFFSVPNHHMEPPVIIALIGALSLLMISRIRFPSLKKITVRK